MVYFNFGKVSHSFPNLGAGGSIAYIAWVYGGGYDWGR